MLIVVNPFVFFPNLVSQLIISNKYKFIVIEEMASPPPPSLPIKGAETQLTGIANEIMKLQHKRYVKILFIMLHYCFIT